MLHGDGTPAPPLPLPQDKASKDAPSSLPQALVDIPDAVPAPEVVGSKERGSCYAGCWAMGV